jgi:hypothetical protein
VFKAAVLSSLSAAGLSGSPWVSPAAAATIDGAFSMDMHVHASFSESWGSMNGQLHQAQRTNVDVIWWTEHDSKMNGVKDAKVVHFTSLTNETGEGGPIKWQLAKTGSLTSASTGGIVSSPASPLDPVAQGSLRVAAQSTGSAQASLGFTPTPDPGQQSWRTNLTGQTLSIEVRPSSIGTNAYLEVYIGTSHHPASGGRTAGQYSLSYRIGGAASPGTRQAVARQGIITLAATPGEWNSLVLRPQQDLEALFPDLDSRDFSLFKPSLSAVSQAGAMASGNFDYLRFTRPTTGEVALGVQDAMMTSYAAKYPNVTQRHGLEVSKGLPHVNWFGGDVRLPSYAGLTKANWLGHLRTTVIPDIHARGGLASWNHPFGVSYQAALPAATQNDLQRQIAVSMLQNKACGADIIEVGYPLRGGVNLAHHVGLWDVMSRNALFLTGNGVSDDHTGVDWVDSRKVSHWTTSAWAPDKTEGALLAALRAGQVWCQSLTGYHGAVDLRADGACPMGSASACHRHQCAQRWACPGASRSCGLRRDGCAGRVHPRDRFGAGQCPDHRQRRHLCQHR